MVEPILATGVKVNWRARGADRFVAGVRVVSDVFIPVPSLLVVGGAAEDHPATPGRFLAVDLPPTGLATGEKMPTGDVK